MTDAPKIFGVEMRRLKTWRNGYELHGVSLNRDIDGRWYWFLKKGTLRSTRNRFCASRDTACRQIERAITRIREAAQKLGT